MPNLILILEKIVEFIFDILQKMSRKNSVFKKKLLLQIRFLSCKNRFKTLKMIKIYVFCLKSYRKTKKNEKKNCTFCTHSLVTFLIFNEKTEVLFLTFNKKCCVKIRHLTNKSTSNFDF